MIQHGRGAEDNWKVSSCTFRPRRGAKASGSLSRSAAPAFLRREPLPAYHTVYAVSTWSRNTAQRGKVQSVMSCLVQRLERLEGAVPMLH